VDEISRFVWLLLNSQLHGFKAVNVAAEGRVTISMVIQLISDVIGQKLDVTVVPSRKSSFTISSDRAKELGYRSRTITEILQCYFEEAGLSRITVR
jgi:hypothetical protein